MDFKTTYENLPADIRTAFSPGFVFLVFPTKYQHFPARQWTEEQIQTYFKEHFNSSSQLIDYPELRVKQVLVTTQPDLFVAVPY